MTSSLRTFIILLGTLLNLCVHAAEPPCSDPCGKPTSWFDFNNFALKVQSPTSKGYGRWSGQWDNDSQDIQVTAEVSDGTVAKVGKILMISGRVMAVQGEIAEPGFELDALDSAVLQQQLAFRLLGYVLPNGAVGLKGNRQVKYSDSHTGIKYATQSASGFVAPPWSVVGTVKLVARDVVDYNLSLTSAKGEAAGQAGKRYSFTLAGRLTKTTNAKLDDSMSLDGWNLFGVGVQTKKTNDSTIIDFNAAPSSESFKTVADVRKHLLAEDSPGARDGAKDFTGFWKANCENAFGLQIQHIGIEGMYSIVFCGPGGCGSPDEGRKTFITGDKHFEVISEEEFLDVGGSGQKTRNIRCTKDPHPILKY